MFGGFIEIGELFLSKVSRRQLSRKTHIKIGAKAFFVEQYDCIAARVTDVIATRHHRWLRVVLTIQGIIFRQCVDKCSEFRCFDLIEAVVGHL